jgi:flagellar hook-associated protein FlgK
VANWINTVSSQTGVTASAANVITIPASQLKLDPRLNPPPSLRINGVSIDLSGVGALAGSADAQRALVSAINGSSDGTFTAKIAPTGELIITNGTGLEGQDITIDNLQGTDSYNALGIARGTYRGQLSLTQPLTDANGSPITKPIQLGFGSAGTPSDLAQLGFRSGAFIADATKDDLLVFVTGAGTAQVSASYSGSPTDAKQALRANPMNVRFLSDTRYRITDVTTNTVLAERDLVPTELNPGISYQGLQLSFTSPPRQGDQFLMDGNSDGIGNNSNMLDMNALETKAVVGNKTIGGAYIDQVNEMGNIARQATISQTALTVVHDQAVAARDQVSGVSLDKEAGDLIRYQQAYQAAAKALQTASQLFDTVLQIR